MFHGRPAYWLAILVLLAGLLLSLLWAVTFGSVDLKMGDVYRVILYKVTEALHFPVGDSEVYGSGSMSDIVWFVRLPRLVLAIGVGMALASRRGHTGHCQNPLADPYVLGVSSGASLGATLAIRGGGGSVPGQRLCGPGGLRRGVPGLHGGDRPGQHRRQGYLGKADSAGTALSAICAAVSNFFLYVINTSSGALEAVVRWTMGSLAAASWDTNLWMLAVGGTSGRLFFWTQYRTLNLMLLGDEAAVTLGTDLHRWRIVYLLAASLLVGFAVYTAGIIGFVGLVIPHVVRILFGTDHKKLIPISALLGAIFLLWSDVLCRVVLPGKEIPIGVLTAWWARRFSST